MSDDLQERTDRYTMKSCRHLVKHCQTLPKGETAETVGEFVEIHRAELHQMKQRTGKGALVLEIGMLAKKWPADLKLASDDAKPDPRDEPLMREAKEIFQGTWL